MADPGRYVAVARNDKPVPDIVHNSIRSDTDEGRQEAMDLAWKLFQSSRGRIPFCLVEIRHG